MLIIFYKYTNWINVRVGTPELLCAQKKFLRKDSMLVTYVLSWEVVLGPWINND